MSKPTCGFLTQPIEVGITGNVSKDAHPLKFSHIFLYSHIW